MVTLFRFYNRDSVDYRILWYVTELFYFGVTISFYFFFIVFTVTLTEKFCASSNEETCTH